MIYQSLEQSFTYHAPKPGQAERYNLLRDSAKNLAYILKQECPESRELSLAITKLEESIMWANKSIAIYGE